MFDDRQQGSTGDLGPHAQNILTALEQNWRRMSSDDSNPLSTFDNAHSILDPLPYAFVIKHTDAGKSEFTVAGQQVQRFFDFDLSGSDFTKIFGPSSAELVAELTEAAFTLPAVTSFAVRAKRTLRRRPLLGQVILMPMPAVNGKVRKLLGGLVTDNGPGLHPMRFEMDNRDSVRCDTENGPFPDRRLSARDHLGRALPKRGHLRLVINNV